MTVKVSGRGSLFYHSSPCSIYANSLSMGTYFDDFELVLTIDGILILKIKAIT